MVFKLFSNLFEFLRTRETPFALLMTQRPELAQVSACLKLTELSLHALYSKLMTQKPELAQVRHFI